MNLRVVSRIGRIATLVMNTSCRLLRGQQMAKHSTRSPVTMVLHVSLLYQPRVLEQTRRPSHLETYMYETSALINQLTRWLYLLEARRECRKSLCVRLHLGVNCTV